MREKPCLNISVSYNATYTSILILLFYILFTSVITTNVDAQEENTLEIYLFDPSDSSYEPMESNIFLEGKEYEIVVWNGTGYAYNATVVVPWNSYVTTVESPSIMIQAPSYEEYSQFVIIASKDGYIPAEKFVTVIKGRLEIVPDQMIVNEKEDFSVLVTDQDGNKISGSSVYIVKEPKGDSDLTNEAGVAYLSAPDVESDEENITIIALKEGYEEGTISIHVKNVQMGNIPAEIIPIIIALIMVILAMLFVRFRKRASLPKPELDTDTITHQNKSSREKQTRKKPIFTKETSDLNLQAEKEPKIEEIRIHINSKKKKTTHLGNEEESQKVIIRKPRRSDYDEWFDGTDDIRYKIDRLTKGIDEKNIDKWFEGEDDIRAKIDEAISKKNRKKNK